MTIFYLDRALQAANSAQRNYDAGDVNAAANRAYYAAFYAVLALFEAAGEDVGKTHSSTLRRFSQEFVLSGKARHQTSGGRSLRRTIYVPRQTIPLRAYQRRKPPMQLQQ